MGRNFYDQADAKLNAGSASFSQLISADAESYNVPQIKADAYAAQHALFAAAFAKVENADHRTRSDTATKNSERAKLRQMAQALAKLIRASDVTDAQLMQLGLHVPAARSSNPPPGVRPKMDMKGVVGRTVNVFVHDSAARRGRAPGAQGAHVYSFVGENYPDDPAEWTYEGDTTKGNFSVMFDNDVPAGARVWATACWYNRKAQSGPLAVPISTNLQGGLASQAS
jgi:hypothetical protein